MQQVTLGDLIRDYREKNGLSIREFAAMSGISKSYVNQLEKNADPRGNPIEPSYETFVKVSSVIGTNYKELLDIAYKPIEEKTNKEEISFEANFSEWLFLKYCYENATQKEKEQVLKILKARERWDIYKSMTKD